MLSSFGMLRFVGWFRTDVSGLRVGSIFEGRLFFDSMTLEEALYVVPKHRCENNVRCVTSEKRTTFRYTAGEGNDLAKHQALKVYVEK
jgi:hypothetical protein